MSLSVAMIVKGDCDDRMALRALESAGVTGMHKGSLFGAQLVVVLTGEEYADYSFPMTMTDGHEAIEDFAWCDDFSAARNHALSLCTGDWVLSLDADDQLTPETCEWIRKATQGDRARYSPVYRDPAGTEFFVSARLFPRLNPDGSPAKWIGRVHEQIVVDAPLVEDPKFVILHDGYEGDQKDKLERNVKLLALELLHEASEGAAWHFAFTLHSANPKNPMVIPILEFCKDGMDDRPAPAKGVYARLVGSYRELGRLERAHELLDEARAKGLWGLWALAELCLILNLDGQWDKVAEVAATADDTPWDDFGNEAELRKHIQFQADNAANVMAGGHKPRGADE